jgi:GT2 family glycosyltransferase
MLKEVTIIIPTYNRHQILVETLPSYIGQKYLKEIILIDDTSDFPLITSAHEMLNNSRIRIITNKERIGAYKSKLIGINAAQSDLILFGEDDAFLEEYYIEKLVNFFCLNKNVGVVSGQIVYMPEKTNYKDVDPFTILKYEELFDFKKLKFNPFARVKKIERIPFTHALFLTQTILLKNITKDYSYSVGNGYREETDFQIMLFCEGKENFILPDCYCYHLNTKDVPVGGQRMNRFSKFYWTIYLNNHFLNKNYNKYKKELKLDQGLCRAKSRFFYDQFYSMFMRPLLRRF